MTQVQVFEFIFPLETIPEYGTIDFFSQMQNAHVQIYRDGEKVYRRHCGVGEGCFWTQFEEVTHEAI